jgi:adenylate kinase
VLDGFPRTTGQAQWLLDLVSNEETYISVVIHLTASKEVVEQRLLNRGRTDDHKEAIDERLHEYEQNIKPILTTFVSEGINVKEVDAERSKEEVHQDVLKIVQSEGQ